MKDLTRFINEELKPRLYGSIPQILPDLHFTKSRKGDKWISPLHYDGSEGTDKRPDRSQVTEKHPTRVWDNSRQEAKDIITLYMERHGLEVWEAVNRLCSIVGIPEPEQRELTPEQRERYADFERRRKLLEESVRRQAIALYHPQNQRAAEVKDYIYRRGFKDWDLCEKMMEGRALLGYISEEEATALQREGIVFPSGVGTAFTLSIPVYSGSTLCGIKFRNIKAPKGMQRYTSYSLYGGGKVLYNLTGIRQTDGAIVVAESELDALIAEYNGLKGFVATGGGELSEELLATARGRGIKRITLLLDNDNKGIDFVRSSIRTAHKKGISIMVATIPEGESLPDGTPIHDIGEYLQAHTKEELQSLLDMATSGSRWLLMDIINTHTREGEATEVEERIIRDKVIALANHTPDEAEREIVLTSYAAYFGLDGKQVFSVEALRAVADRERAEQDALHKKEKAEEAAKAIDSLLKDGRVDEALAMMGDAASTLKKVGDREKYGDLLRIPTREERLRRFKEKPEALLTSYQFTEGAEDEGAALPLTLPSGALTILAAPTSHGKSTFLRNLAIDVAKRYGDKSVLYFTFEESEEDVWAQFTNSYIGKQLHAVSKRHPQLQSIVDYYKTGEATYIGGSNAEVTTEEFKRMELEFSSGYLDSGKIRIFYRDYNLETLLEALEFAVCNIPTKAIFIDYIQILRSQKLAKQPRTEQLKEICISLKDFSVKYKLPIILAAQLTREAKTPIRMDNNQMAESSDIEKAANTIICLWRSKFKPTTQAEKLGKEEKEELETLKEKGFVFGKEGKLFAKVTKRRGDRGVGMYSIFDFIGYSGKIVENYKPEEPEQSDFSNKAKEPINPFLFDDEKPF